MFEASTAVFHPGAILPGNPDPQRYRTRLVSVERSAAAERLSRGYTLILRAARGVPDSDSNPPGAAVSDLVDMADNNTSPLSPEDT